MPHTFDHVPLVQASLTVMMEEPVVLGAVNLYEIQAVGIEYFNESTINTSATDLGEPGFSLSLGAQPVFSLRNASEGTNLNVFQNALVVAWTLAEGASGYVHYPKLRGMMAAALRVFPGKSRLAQTAYQTKIPLSKENAWDFLQPEWIPPRVHGLVLTHQSYINYRLDDGVDFGLRVYPEGVGENGSMVVMTSAGAQAGDDVRAALDRVHAAINNEFFALVTPEYRERWGYKWQ